MGEVQLRMSGSSILFQSYRFAGTYHKNPCALLPGRDWQIRDQDIPKLDEVHKRYGIQIVRHSTWDTWRGRYSAWALFLLVLVANGILTVLFVKCGSESVLNSMK